MKYNKLTGIFITSIIMLLVLSSSILGLGASAPVQRTSANLGAEHLPVQLESVAAFSNRTGDQRADTAEMLSAASTWVPPVPAYKVVIAPEVSHSNRELIFGELDGIYQLDYGYLLAAGLPAATLDTLDPRSFRMFYMGEEIAIQVEGETDGSFDPGVGGDPDDAILFYGMGVDSMFDQGLLPTNKYTEANIYWLTFGGVDGARMASKDGSITGTDAESFSHTERMENNRWYFSAYPFEDDADHWYWEWMQPLGVNQAASREYDFTIQHLASTIEPGVLTVNMFGYTAGQHHLRLYVNDNLVFDDDSSWEDFDAFEATTDFDQTYLVEGTNTIKVEIVNDVGKTKDKVYTNWIEVVYDDELKAESNILKFGNDQASLAQYSVGEFSENDIQVYDVSDHGAVQSFENVTIGNVGPPYTADFGDTASATSQYVAQSRSSRLVPSDFQEVIRPVSLFTPTDLLDTANEADYIVITHADFWDEAYRLADFREHRYRVALVDAQQIYDQFNGGLMSAESIHDFLEYAHLNWTAPQPMFVVLIGDGTSDMRNYDSQAGTYIPPYLWLADHDLGETAVQNRFVTLTGDDFLPDMHIGRLPANDIDEAKAMVDKIIMYEVGCKCDGWNYRTLFIADDQQGGGGNFIEFSDRVAEGYYDDPPTIKFVPDPPYSVQKVYFRDNCDESLPEGEDSIECRAEVANSLNTDGALFVSWIGHSTKDFWAVERIVDKDLIDQLDNAPCLPLSIAMTCFEGSFHDPKKTSLAEYAVRTPEDGFIASWSPTGFGLATGHDIMEQGLMLALLHDDDILEVGTAITSAKEHLVAETGDSYLDLVETFILLGDPAVMPKTDEVCSQVPTAVRMESYGIQAQPDALHITWRTVDETNILGFNVLRRAATLQNDGPTQSYEQINTQVMVALWSGLGVGAEYFFVDSQVTPGVSYDYHLEVINVDGTSTQYDLGTAFTLSAAELSSQPKR